MFSIKHRGISFSDIVGHKKILSEVKIRSKTLDFPEVMIFEGESGCGKTTLAFIVAKLLNCYHPVEKNGFLEPCNTCPSCLDVIDEKFIRDISFFDASSMSKEDVSNLNNLVDVYALNDKNKILIIDEAQELSKAGKGATLKLLEKKRQNVYFILCTMDTEALSTAVKRRGQVYKFRKIDSFEIAEYLLNVIKKEDQLSSIPEEFLTKGIFTIAESSNGSPGIALGYLERCLVGQLYDEQTIIQELGLINENKVFDVLVKLLSKDTSVFDDFKTLDLKEFYLKGIKILQECFVYKKFKVSHEEWKIKNYNRLNLSQLENLYTLIDHFNNVEYDTYFKESSFYFEMIKYFNKFLTIPTIQKRKPIQQ